MYYKNIYYEKINNGEKNIVFLHGWANDHTSFNNVFECIKNITIYTLDLEGFGKSQIDHVITLDEYASNIIEMIENLDIKNPIIIGHSFGGRIAMKMLTKRNFKTILISTPIYDYRSLKTRMILFLNKFLKKKIISCDYKNSNDLHKKIMVKAIKDMKNINIKSFKQKPLIIHGKKDKAVPIKVAKKISKKYKFSLIEFESNHFLQYHEEYKLQKVIEAYVFSL